MLQEFLQDLLERTPVGKRGVGVRGEYEHTLVTAGHRSGHERAVVASLRERVGDCSLLASGEHVLSHVLPVVPGSTGSAAEPLEEPACPRMACRERRWPGGVNRGAMLGTTRAAVPAACPMGQSGADTHGH